VRTSAECTSGHRYRAAEYQAVINFSHHPEKWILVREDYSALVRAMRLRFSDAVSG
jgi:hypothetical protein